jgi:hypothetical protein
MYALKANSEHCVPRIWLADFRQRLQGIFNFDCRALQMRRSASFGATMPQELNL